MAEAANTETAHSHDGDSPPRRLRNRAEQVPTTPSHASDRLTSVPMHEGHLSDLALEESIDRQVEDSFAQTERHFQVREVKGSEKVLKCVIISTVLTIFLLVIIDSTTNRYIERGMSNFLTWVEDNPGIGFFAFVGVNFLCTLIFFPVSVLAPGGGFVFAHAFGLILGVLLGVCAVFLGAGAGAVLAFFVGRYLARDAAQQWKHKYPIFEALDTVLVDKGVRIIVLLHLCPIIPFNVLNMIAGTTSMKLWTYTWTLIAIIPGTTAYVFFGATAGSLADSKNKGGAEVWEIVIMVVGLALGIVGITVMTHYAKKELRKIAYERETELASSRAARTAGGDILPADIEIL